MIGLLAGISMLIGLPSGALSHDLRESYGSPLGVFLVGVVVMVAAFIVGLLLVRTVGMAALGFSVGSFIAALIALGTSQAEFAPGLLFNAVVGIVIQRGQALRMGAT